MNLPEKDCYHVLMADDSEDDRFLMRSAIQREPRLKIIAEVSNGSEAIAYLRGCLRAGSPMETALPDLLLLDLNMPFKNGFEVLEWLGGQRFDNLTVVVLTDSINPGHVKRALDLGADYFHLKTRSNNERHAMAVALTEYLIKATSPVPLRHPPTHL